MDSNTPQSHEAILAVIRVEMQFLRADLEKQTDATKQLLEALAAAKLAAAVLKWAIAVGGAIAAAWFTVFHGKTS